MSSTLNEFATGAVKASVGKPRVALVPSELVLAAARAFTFGAIKYDDHNWCKGIPISELYSALQRHLLAFNSGEDLDPESKLNHLDHAAASLAMLIETLRTKPKLDDRYHPSDKPTHSEPK